MENVMNNLGMYIIFSCIIYAFLVLSRQTKEYLKSMVVAFIVANVISLDALSKYFPTHFIECALMEVTLIVLTVIVIKLVNAFANFNNKVLLMIMEILLAFGLCFAYYYIGAFLVSYIN